MMLQNAPKTLLEMRALLDGVATLMNAGLPELGAFHAAVPRAGTFSKTSKRERAITVLTF
jgi:hypothetical protein